MGSLLLRRPSVACARGEGDAIPTEKLREEFPHAHVNVLSSARAVHKILIISITVNRARLPLDIRVAAFQRQVWEKWCAFRTGNRVLVRQKKGKAWVTARFCSWTPCAPTGCTRNTLSAFSRDKKPGLYVGWERKKICGRTTATGDLSALYLSFVCLCGIGQVQAPEQNTKNLFPADCELDDRG